MHGNIYLVFIVLATNLAIASSLRCYKCGGPDDGRAYPTARCEEEQTEVTCPSEKTKCGRYHHTIKSVVLTTEVEARACVYEDDCLSIRLSCEAIVMAGGQCEYSCCDRDFCNGCPLATSSVLMASMTLVSILLLF